MDELDFLKKHWKKQESNFPHLSYNEIHKMLWKKSSSIVRWIFVISVCELFLSALLSIFLIDEAYWQEMDEINLKEFSIALYIFCYSVTLYFIYMFYRNYQKISNIDNTATLMKNILKTRKTVKNYIAFVLISNGLSGLIVTYFTVKHHSTTSQVQDVAKYSYEFLDWAKFILIGFVVMAIFLGAIWLFYRLIYGILLRKLRKNYKELKELEVEN